MLNNALFSAVEGVNQTKSVESHVECIQLLIDKGANINSEKKGTTVLMLATGKGYIELVSELLHRGGWVNHENADAKTPLHYAIDN